MKKYKGKCKMEGYYLIILGIRYGVEDLHNLPYDLSGFHASSKSDENKHIFFGELNPFSNFHPAKFTVDGQDYHCDGQFIQESKALLFNDEESAQKIRLASNGLECKNLGCNIAGAKEDVWRKSAKT